MIINDTSNGKFYKNSSGSEKNYDFADQLNQCDEVDFDDEIDQNSALGKIWAAFGSEAKVRDYSE